MSTSKSSQKAEPIIGRYVVIVFDICSSTKIVEDLTQNDSITFWSQLHTDLKTFLYKEKAHVWFEMYKFIGDGWILLIKSRSLQVEHLMIFLKSLCIKYDELIKQYICNPQGPNHGPLARPVKTGLTMGIADGNLVRVIMRRRAEYIGRPLNLATRLQSGTKRTDGVSPANTVLISSAFHASIEPLLTKYNFSFKQVNREMWNIGAVNCIEYIIDRKDDGFWALREKYYKLEKQWDLVKKEIKLAKSKAELESESVNLGLEKEQVFRRLLGLPPLKGSS